MEWLTLGSAVGALMMGLLLYLERGKRADAQRQARMHKAQAEVNEKLTKRLRVRLAEKEKEIRELENHLPPAALFDRMFDTNSDG